AEPGLDARGARDGEIGERNVERLVAGERSGREVSGRTKARIDDAVLAASDEEEEHCQDRNRCEERFRSPMEHHEPTIICNSCRNFPYWRGFFRKSGRTGREALVRAR